MTERNKVSVYTAEEIERTTELFGPELLAAGIMVNLGLATLDEAIAALTKDLTPEKAAELLAQIRGEK